MGREMELCEWAKLVAIENHTNFTRSRETPLQFKKNPRNVHTKSTRFDIFSNC